MDSGAGTMSLLCAMIVCVFALTGRYTAAAGVCACMFMGCALCVVWENYIVVYVCACDIVCVLCVCVYKSAGAHLESA